MLHRFLLLALLLAATPALAQTESPEPLVVTTGEGLVTAVPDRAWVTITAESRAQSPLDAQRQNADAMRPLQDELRSAGLPADAIRTIGYDVQYEWDYVEGRRVGRGYVARNTIEVRVDEIDRLGEYLDKAVTYGATSLGGVRFDLKDRASLEREALRLAVADAHAKAVAAAEGAGRAVDRILRIQEQGTAAPTPMPMMRELAQAGPAADAAPPIAAGQTEIRARVTLTAVLE